VRETLDQNNNNPVSECGVSRRRIQQRDGVINNTILMTILGSGLRFWATQYATLVFESTTADRA